MQTIMPSLFEKFGEHGILGLLAALGLSAAFFERRQSIRIQNQRLRAYQAALESAKVELAAERAARLALLEQARTMAMERLHEAEATRQSRRGYP